jgi:hypothetical protein
MSTPPSGSTPQFSQEQQAMIYLLSRLDTLHDFAGARTSFTPRKVCEMLDRNSPTAFKLSKTFLLEKLKSITSPSLGRVSSKTIEDLFYRVEKTSIDINNPGDINPRMFSRITDSYAFEPRAVLFYELYQDVLGDSINIGKFFANDKLVFCHIKDDGTLTYGDSDKNPITAGENAFKSENISVINLGVPEEDGRSASGIFAFTQNPQTPPITVIEGRRNKLRNIITGFFGNSQVIKAVVDFSNAPLDLLFNRRTEILCNVASDWDSASKSSECNQGTQGTSETPDPKSFESPSDDLQKSVFSTTKMLTMLEDKKAKFSSTSPPGNEVVIKINDPNYKTDVKTLQQCLNEKGCTSGTCKCSYNSKGFDIASLFDIKRTGDAYQVLMAKKLGAIFVTHDHLAFLKARLNGVNSIFTSIDRNRNRLLVLFKAGVDEDAMKMRAREEIKKLKDVILKHESYITYVNKKFENLFTTNTDFLINPTALPPINDFIFDLTPPVKNEIITDAVKEIAILKKHLTTLESICTSFQVHNLSTIQEYIYKFINYTYLIDIKVKHVNSSSVTREYIKLILY